MKEIQLKKNKYHHFYEKYIKLDKLDLFIIIRAEMAISRGGHTVYWVILLVANITMNVICHIYHELLALRPFT